jgi:hypothetical protein
VDNAAVPRVSNRGRTVSIRDPRSRWYLLEDVDLLLKTTGLQILKTPAQSPQAKAQDYLNIYEYIRHK